MSDESNALKRDLRTLAEIYVRPRNSADYKAMLDAAAQIESLTREKAELTEAGCSYIDQLCEANANNEKLEAELEEWQRMYREMRSSHETLWRERDVLRDEACPDIVIVCYDDGWWRAEREETPVGKDVPPYPHYRTIDAFPPARQGRK